MSPLLSSSCNLLASSALSASSPFDSSTMSKVAKKRRRRGISPEQRTRPRLDLPDESLTVEQLEVLDTEARRGISGPKVISRCVKLSCVSTALPDNYFSVMCQVVFIYCKNLPEIQYWLQISQKYTALNGSNFYNKAHLFSVFVTLYCFFCHCIFFLPHFRASIILKYINIHYIFNIRLPYYC